MKFRRILAAVAIGCVASALSWPLQRFDSTLAVDYLNALSKPSWLRSLILPNETSRVAIIAIDEETYATPPFQGKPQATYTPQIARVLNAVLDAGPKAIGFDIVFPTSNEQLLKGYDRDFFRALQRGAAEGRLVLGFLQHQVVPIKPYQAQRSIIGAGNIRPLNAISDTDEIVRRMPLQFQSLDPSLGLMPSLSADLARRSGASDRNWTREGLLQNGILLNFNRPTGSARIYSLADIHACAEMGNVEFFRTAFADKVVLLGAVLDDQDRLLASNRFATEPEGSLYAPGCRDSALSEYRGSRSRPNIAGVLLHARAIDNLVMGSWLRMPARPYAIACILGLSLIGALMALRYNPVPAVAAALSVLLIWTGVAVVVYLFGFVVPLISGGVGLSIAVFLGMGYRVAAGDLARQSLARAFALYLPPAELRRIMDEDKPPELGGEARQVSVLFADIAGFTKLSEQRQPKEVVGDLNLFFTRMSDIVEAHGGFVDKFIGDGLLAVFGAPLIDPQHNARAVEAATRMVLAMHEVNAALKAAGAPELAIRIGLHCGEVILGNIGSPRRFNYTVIGDTVNLASRLEGCAKIFGASIIASGEMRGGFRGGIVVRHLPRVRVVGRNKPVDLFEPMVPDMAKGLDLEAFDQAMAAFAEGRFANAETQFHALAERGDRAARQMEHFAQDFAYAPPVDWHGIIDLKAKGGG